MIKPMNQERYDRQLRIPQFGQEGQRRLAASRVLVVGAGGLGSPVILYLAAAGIGHLGIADGDSIDLSNLNRQVLHRTQDIGGAKVRSAARAVGQLNPEVRLQLYQERLDLQRATELAEQYDLLVDASDSFPSKYLINDAAVRAGKPLVHGGVEGFIGQIAVLGLSFGPCLRCIFAEPPPEPKHARAIIGPTAGAVGAIQASEAIKYLAAIDHDGGYKMLSVNLLHLEFHSLTVEQDPDCPVCRS